MFVPKEVLDPISGKCIIVMTEKAESDIGDRFAKASQIQRRLGINLASYGNAKRKPQHKPACKLMHRRQNRIITKNMKNVMVQEKIENVLDS